MSRRSVSFNDQPAVYLPVGTIALPAELVEILRERALKSSLVNVVRAALIKCYLPEYSAYQKEEF